MCVILDLMFLSFYCDYIVDEFAVFSFLQKKFSEIVNFRRPTEATENKRGIISAAIIFGGGVRPPKISNYFRQLCCWPPKIMAYFWLIFSSS
jgi:hypothetical protein